jgi:ribosomal protein S18 acetylase RimI-like enzyme
LYEQHRALDPERFIVEGDVREHYTRWLETLSANPRAVVLVSGPEGAPTGYLIGEVDDAIPHFWMPACGYLHDIWVAENARHQGTGEALVSAALERFRALGAAQVRLVTATGNESARRFFASFGFRPCLVEMLVSLEPAK